MSEYVITTDTAADLPASYLKKHDIHVVPLYYSVDGEMYGDKKTMEIKDFYAMLRSGKPSTTSSVNPANTEIMFRDLLEQGHNILHIAFSSGLSGSYNVANMVATSLSEEYTNQKIIVIDSLCASLGQGLLVHKAVCNREKGMNIEDNAKWLEENKLNLVHDFTVDNLHHLQRGGRISKTAATFGTMLNIKPVLHVDNEGKLVSLYNVRSRKKSIAELASIMAKNIEGFDNDIFFISHGDCEKDAKALRDMIMEQTGIKECLIAPVSPTIGAHSGPGTLALFYMGKER